MRLRYFKFFALVLLLISFISADAQRPVKRRTTGSAYGNNNTQQKLCQKIRLWKC